MPTRRQPGRLLDQDRYARWVQASHALDSIFPALVQVIQGLGRLDAELCAEDTDYVARREIAANSKGALFRFMSRDDGSLDHRVNLSALWLFGAYEAVRTLDYAIKKRRVVVSPGIAANVDAVKQKFSRPRMLLAKHEPARRHEATDRLPARPWYQRGSLAWRVAPRTIVSRRALADSLLKLLDRIAGAQVRQRKSNQIAH